jgi:hypothetical protein
MWVLGKCPTSVNGNFNLSQHNMMVSGSLALSAISDMTFSNHSMWQFGVYLLEEMEPFSS